MNDRETRRYGMFGRVVTFGNDHQADFAPGGEGRKRFTNLARIIKDLDDGKAGQGRGGRDSLEVLLNALLLDVRNVARTTAAIAQDEPGFADSFHYPHSPSQADLLTAADTMLARLRPAAGDNPATLAAKTALVARFVAHELPAGFDEDLAADRATIPDKQGKDNAGVESTAAIGRLSCAGMNEVNYLDAMAHNKYAREADILRAWVSASHIERAPKRERTGGDSGPQGSSATGSAMNA